ncbi:hypothetical protein M3J07_007443 [Ascochyta lentis]
MSETYNDAARRLGEYGIELCTSNNNRSDVRTELQNLATTSVPEEWREELLAHVLERLTTHPSWATLPEAAVAITNNKAHPTTDSNQDPQQEDMGETIRRLVEAQVQAYVASMGLPNHGATPSTSVQTVNDRPSKTMKLPDVGKFSGNRRAYRTFKSQMKDKLRSMGDQEAVLGVAYMFNRLEGQAAQVGLSWKDRNPMGTTAQFWDFLDEQYKDSLFEERSWQKLQTITMKKSNQSVESFNAEFIQLAYDAAEEDNTKNLKTRYMSAL